MLLKPYVKGAQATGMSPTVNLSAYLPISGVSSSPHCLHPTPDTLIASTHNRPIQIDSTVALFDLNVGFVMGTGIDLSRTENPVFHQLFFPVG
jgi:hypothetical protein